MMTFVLFFIWFGGGTGEIEGRRRGRGWKEVNTSKGGKRVGKGKGKGAGND